MFVILHHCISPLLQEFSHFLLKIFRDMETTLGLKRRNMVRMNQILL